MSAVSAMTAELALRRLRAFLFALAAVLFVGAIGELIAAKHYQESMQLVPFGLCLLGLVALAAAWRRPDRLLVTATVVLNGVIALGSLLGIYEHVTGNMELYREIHPHAGGWQLLHAGLTGRDPLLAPGVLAVAATVAIAATFAARALAAAPAVSGPRCWAPASRASTRSF